MKAVTKVTRMSRAQTRHLRAARRCSAAVDEAVDRLDDNLTIILSEIQVLLLAKEVKDEDLHAIGHAALRCTRVSLSLIKTAAELRLAA